MTLHYLTHAVRTDVPTIAPTPSIDDRLANVDALLDRCDQKRRVEDCCHIAEGSRPNSDEFLQAFKHSSPATAHLIDSMADQGVATVLHDAGFLSGYMAAIEQVRKANRGEA